jgi:hypothetical protein
VEQVEILLVVLVVLVVVELVVQPHQQLGQ